MSQTTRREFLAVATAGAVAFGASPVAGKEIRGGLPWAPRRADVPDLDRAGSAEAFFTAEESAFIDAATARILPADELGPGANELGVTTFIDRQLAGPYGHAARWYMQGPWQKGESTQGYQSRMTPAQLYRAAIKAIDDKLVSGHGGKRFTQLSADEQDAVLQSVESGELSLEGVDGKTFFRLLLQNTKEGAFSDPLYGGNRDMAGWKMLGFPGARYDYLPWVDKHNVRYTLPPVGILGRPAWHAPD